MEWELLADQPLGQKLIKKWFWLYFFAYLIGPASYLIKVIISNSVSVADVGVLYSIIWLITLFNVYNDLGLTESLQYFLPRYRLKKQYNYIKTSIYISLFVQIFTAILIALFLRLWAPRLAEHYFHSQQAIIILKYFCFYFLGINLFQVIQGIFAAFQDTFSSQFIEFIRNRAVVCFTFFFFISGKQSIERYSLNRILWLIIGILVALVVFRRKYRKLLFQGKFVWEKPMLKEYGKYALRCFLGLNITTLFWQISQQMVIAILWAEPAWYFTNFISLLTIAGIIIWPIVALVFPLVSELITKNDTKKLSLLFNFFYTYISLFALSLWVFLTALGPEVALVLFGKKFLFSGELLSYAAIFNVITVLLGFNFAVLAGMGKIKERVKIMLIGTTIHVILNSILMPIIGIYWVVISMILSRWILFILSYLKIHKKIPIHIDRKPIIKNTIILLIMGTGIWLLKWYFFVWDDIQRYRNLWIGIAFAGVFYSIFGACNYKKILLLKEEIKKLKK